MGGICPFPEVAMLGASVVGIVRPLLDAEVWPLGISVHVALAQPLVLWETGAEARGPKN